MDIITKLPKSSQGNNMIWGDSGSIDEKCPLFGIQQEQELRNFGKYLCGGNSPQSQP